MSMLAEPRRKQKLSSDPRNLAWKNDESKFGQKLMEKMGWSAGKGLGANGTGNVDAIKVTLKSDNRGVGCSRNHADNWIAHQDDFNVLLASLNSADEGSAPGYGSDQGKKRVQNLEEKGRSAKGRVHYMKFAKGKDLSAKSSEDLACIFGQRKSKSAPATPQDQSEANSEEESDDKDTAKPESGIMTFTSGTSVQDYFAKKMQALKSAGAGVRDVIQRDDVEEPRCGFGFGFVAPSTDASGLTKQSESSEEESKPKKKKKKDKKRRDDEEEEGSGENVTATEEQVDESPQKKKKKKKKDREEETKDESPLVSSEDICSEEPPRKKKKKKKNRDVEEAEENSAVEEAEEEEPDRKKKKKKRRSVEEETNEIAEEAEEADEEETDRKRKKKKKNSRSQVEDEDELPLPADDNSEEKAPKSEKKSRNGMHPVDDTEVGDVKKTDGKITKDLIQQNIADVTQRLKAVQYTGPLSECVSETKTRSKSQSDDDDDTVLKWGHKQKQYQNEFTGSNFEELKGYGHRYGIGVTCLPVSKKRVKSLKKSKKDKRVKH